MAFLFLQVQIAVESNTITVTQLGDLPKLQLQITSWGGQRVVCAKLENGEYLCVHVQKHECLVNTT